MRLILALLLLIFAGAASVQAGETPTVLPSDKDPVPYPVPVGYDRCVVVVFSESVQIETGKNGKVIEPPFDKFNADGINASWSAGDLRSVKHCTPRKA
ncbi:hypothetical protein [Hwanghaeella sp.]|uniref:hypothetical protein n=1 Tax=Hwanghaeella sp. TaxID=2605943 RepID=UPI003CCC3B2D